LALDGDVRFKIDGKMFGGRDEAGSDGDVTVFFAAERAGVLELSAFGIEGVRFEAVGIVNGEDAVVSSASGGLMVQKRKADIVESVDIPIAIREEVLELLITDIGFAGDGG